MRYIAFALLALLALAATACSPSPAEQACKMLFEQGSLEPMPPASVLGEMGSECPAAMRRAGLDEFVQEVESPRYVPIPSAYPSCDDARIAFRASVQAKESLEAEGRLTPDLQRFHNDTIIKAGGYIESHCGGRY